jgi:uncharacterized protein (UPF0332 family)
MTPEAISHLAKARQELDKATAMLGIALADEAGRAAYLAAFHAAQAFIFEQTGRTPKTHQGVRSRFGALAREEPRMDVAMRRFLTDGYDLKSVADYAIGPDAEVSAEDAQQAIVTASHFVNRIQEVLGHS